MTATVVRLEIIRRYIELLRLDEIHPNTREILDLLAVSMAEIDERLKKLERYLIKTGGQP